MSVRAQLLPVCTAPQPPRVVSAPPAARHWGSRPVEPLENSSVKISHNYCTVHRVHLSARRLGWGAQKNEVTSSNTYSKMVARYGQDVLAVHAAWPATVKDERARCPAGSSKLRPSAASTACWPVNACQRF